LAFAFSISHWVAVRIEWCKAKARLERWQEEVEILREEQRRVLQFLDYSIAMWSARADASLPGADRALQSGIAGYALRQVLCFRRMKRRFQGMWGVEIEDASCVSHTMKAQALSVS
jgi:hypothetical protein